MTKDDVMTILAVAGVASPQVVPFRKRDGKTFFDVYSGERLYRKHVRISADANDDEIAFALIGLG